MSKRLRKPPPPPPPRRLSPGTETGSDQSDPFLTPNTSSHSLIYPPQPPYSPAFRQGSLHGSDSSECLPLSNPSRHERDESQSSKYPTTRSRRASQSSEGGLGWEASGYPFSPTRDNRSHSRTDDDEPITTQTVVEKYAIVPFENLLVFPEDVEKDDYLHNPDPNDADRDCDVCTRRGAVNLVALTVVVVGVVTLFVVYPVLTFIEKLIEPSGPVCADDPMCLDVGPIPHLQNIRYSLIDPDTPESAKSKISIDGKKWQLVFSDEFNKDGRTFYEGDDPFFQAVDLWYGVTKDLEWYDPDAVTTKNGKLEIRFDAFPNHELNYRSGMVQSWNQLCFTGGRLEASISLPGRGDTSGFWPGFWAMGNLGRPGYAATTEGMWPYSYDNVCDAGITPNQSSTDGISFLPGMRLPACTCKGEDHPSPGKSRSAPEIDVIEASVHALDPKVPSDVGDVSQSMQVAPFDVWYMPNFDFYELYDPRITAINDYRGGPYQQAISGITTVNNHWYDGRFYQVYAFEYKPGPKGEITWFVGKDKTWKLDARALGPNGNIGQRVIAAEPMALVMNFGMSKTFAFLNVSGLTTVMPATMRFDYVRIYQDPDAVSVTCDPPGTETTEYIQKHRKAYDNANLTTWKDAGYAWPKNSFMHGC
ncbi:beta-glucan synthesis-associated protein KRE6 [Histoplasma capsulatum var. duboisii H88]|uniref:Beta-glucan synthesis-associated protein KRE6 n=1 Tax=Ajellomyces capsulatus (strain H88) TaxID=544711 RepID=F0UJW6_AJEC8|nr:beta-glucan synthesis-associated protein KRE6 [Histoplasma capsulatum var. duboisii H88]QSS57285.1 beta-glucan synthesis-associated protein KRE6 [Histoplasma capsulatum var. duboisii H88]